MLDSRMRILVVTNYNPFNREHGGAENATFELAKALKNEGHSPALLVAGDATQFSMYEGIPTFSVEGAILGDSYIPFLNAKNIEKINGFLGECKLEAILTQTEMYLGVVAQNWAIEQKIPIFMNIHVNMLRLVELVKNSSIFAGLLNLPFFKKQYLDFYRKCDALVVLNEQSAKDIQQYGYKGGIVQIPNGRDLKAFKPLKSRTKPDDTVNLLFVGHIAKHKNQSFLVEMMQFLPKNFQLTLVGSFQNKKYVADIKSFIADLGLSDRIKLMGATSYTDLPLVFAAADMFVSASKMEVQSLVVLEALAAGLPIVALENDTTLEVVDESNGCLLDKDALSENFAARVAEIATLQDKEYKQLSASSLVKARRFDWKNVVRKYEKAIAEYANTAKTSSRQINSYTGFSFNSIFINKLLKANPFHKDAYNSTNL